jgi:tetratricopeptide (TPR) repeat protein
MPTQRTRGIAATVAGLQKLREIKAAGEADGTRLTFEGIADRISRNSQTSVDPRTVRRFFNGEGIDRDYVLAICTALDLEVTEIVDPNEWHPAKSDQTTQSVVTSATLKTDPPTVHEWQGRQAEINELQQALNNDKICLIGITAAGGYGKSALAAKFKEQLTLDWRVWWVSFNQAYGFAQFGRWLLEKLGKQYDEKQPEEELIKGMVDGLIEKPCLLVLDNFETVLRVDGKSVYSQFLNKWLQDGINSKLLLTSREKPIFATNLLRLRRDHWLALKGLAEADAIRLVTVDYGLTGTETELALFVNKMGCHPLLMQLVCSSMVDQFGMGVTVTTADQLGLDMFTVEGYHRDVETSVGEVVAASLARLSPRLGMLLKRLSVLRIAFNEPLAQGLAAEVTEPELRHLARLSLLQESLPKWKDGKQTEKRRFEFLSLIQMFVQQQADSEVLRSAHQAALDYFLAHLPAPPWESLEDLTAHLEGFYHAGELGEWQLAYDILNEERGGEGKNKSVDRFLDLQGFYQKRAMLYEQMIAGSQPKEVFYSLSLNRLGLCYESLGQYEKAIILHHQAHDISEEIGDQQGVANSLGNLGNCYQELEEYEAAISYHEKSLETNDKIGDQQLIANCLGNLGNCYYSLGKYEIAISYHQQSFEISKDIKDWQGVANAFGNSGLCYHSLGQYEAAFMLCQQYHDISKEIGFQRGIAVSLGSLGQYYYSWGKYEEAISHHSESLAIKKEISDQRGVAISLGNLGLCYYFLGQYEAAADYHKQHYEISKEIGTWQQITSSLENLVNCYYSLGQCEKVLFLYQQHHDFSEKIGSQQGIAISLCGLGNCYNALKQHQKALKHYQTYCDYSRKIGDKQGIAISLHNIGATWLELEQYSEAESKIQESLVISNEIENQSLIAHSLKALAEIAHQTNQPHLALSHCQNALSLSQELGIPLVKDCEELLAKIQENLGKNQ